MYWKILYFKFWPATRFWRSEKPISCSKVHELVQKDYQTLSNSSFLKCQAELKANEANEFPYSSTKCLRQNALEREVPKKKEVI